MPTATVTVLFSDLVGSTEMLSRVGEVAADELRREHFALLRGAVAASGGTEVKNLGDGLMVVFDGVARALECAVGMHQAMAARPAAKEPMAIRVGVSVGEVDVDDGDYFGVPVVEAARLCAHADAGEILVAGLVRTLARRRSDVDFEPVGELELKGLDEPVETWRVRWTPRRVEALAPVPARIAAVGSARFVGRDAELAVFAEAWKDARAGVRRAVLLSGEPGIGKTTMAARFALDAAEAGAWVLYGRCDEDLFVPYQPWVEALGALVDHVEDDVVAGHVEACGPVLGRLVPNLGRRVGSTWGGDGETDLHLMVRAVVDLLARASVVAPLVVVIDDLHWADASTVQLLRQVLAADRPLHVLLVATFRDSEISPVLADGLAVLRREPGVERVAVKGLGDQDLLTLLELVAGHDVGDPGAALRDWLLAETDGNPFFVGELLRHLSETGRLALDPATGRWVLADDDDDLADVPVSVSEVVAHRVARLGADTERVLTLAAVIGRDFDVELLAAVAELDVDRVAELCDVAVEAAVLREDGPDAYSFTHALITRSLYGRLSASRRVRAHRTVAEALEDLTGGVDRVGELAHHWAQATRPEDVAKAADYALRAGDRALAALAPADAAGWYTQTLDLTDPDQPTRTRIAALTGLGEAQKLLDDPTFRDTLADAARLATNLGEGDLLVRAALANFRGHASQIGAVDHDRVAVLRTSLDAIGPDDSPDRARLLAQLSLETAWGGDHAVVNVAHEAVAIARRIGDPHLYVEIVSLTDQVRSTPDRFPERRRDVTDAVALVDSGVVADPMSRWLAHRAAAYLSVMAGDRAALVHHTEKTGVAADQIGHGFHLVVRELLSGLVAAVDGDPDRIDEIAARLLDVATETGQPDGIVQWSGLVTVSCYQRGSLDTLIPAVEQLVADHPGLPIYTSVLAWAHAFDDPSAARPILEHARQEGFPAPYDLTWATTQALWAETAHLVGDVHSAVILVPRFDTTTDLLTTSNSSIGAVGTHSQGLLHLTLGAYDAAIGRLEHALQFHRRLESPFLICRTQTALADAYARSGQRDRAEPLALEALAVGDAKGYGYVQRDARAVLDRIG